MTWLRTLRLASSKTGLPGGLTKEGEDATVFLKGSEAIMNHESNDQQRRSLQESKGWQRCSLQEPNGRQGFVVIQAPQSLRDPFEERVRFLFYAFYDFVTRRIRGVSFRTSNEIRSLLVD